MVAESRIWYDRSWRFSTGAAGSILLLQGRSRAHQPLLRTWNDEPCQQSVKGWANTQLYDRLRVPIVLEGDVLKTSIRVLLVDDHECWRKFASTTLQKGQPESEVIGEAADGLQAIQLAQHLQPDLILLDIGLPLLNGIEVAQRILHHSPTSRILFMSENRSADIAEAALSTGASGYIVKSDAGGELLPAVRAVLEDKKFTSSSLTNRSNDKGVASIHRHEVAFYPDDASTVIGFARFIESALNAGNAVIVVVTASHRPILLKRLEADGVNVAASIEQGSYVAMDASEAMAALTVDGIPDPDRCAKVIGDVATRAAKGVRGENGRVMACGEIAPTMLLNGDAKGAVQIEQLWDEITRDYGVHTLCGYLSSAFLPNNSALEKICSVHSAVHGRELTS